MKTKQLLSVAVVFLFSNCLIAQNFQGVITSSIKYIKVPEEVQGLESMLPQEMTMYVDKQKVRLEQSVMGGKQIIIVDSENNESHVLMDMMGQKIHMNTSGQEYDDESKVTYVYKNETKMISGYKCKLVEAKDEDGDITKIYYTTEIQVWHKDFSDLKGFPMEYNVNKDGMEMTITVSNIEKKKVDSSQFEVPDGYTEMTPEQMGMMMDK